MKTTLSLVEARQLALHHQQLLTSDAPSGRAGTLSVLEQLGYVQIDTISVVERAHHHVLWSRQADYNPSYLNELIDDKSAFEYWSHAAAYLPMRDFRYSLISKRNRAKRIAEQALDKKMRKYVLERIQAEGALQARHFENSTKTTGGWWEHKPAKIALERLFFEGTLMISQRINFQKVYDITDRVLPEGINRTMPTIDEYSRHLITTAINAHGFASVEEISYLRGGDSRRAVLRAIQEMSENGELLPVTIEGSKQKYYSSQTNLALIGLIPTQNIHILSPFDNAVIQRKRLAQLWDFDYQVECYVPAPKRKFGYFCLPIMVGDTFIGRIDAKAERRSKRLIINSLYIEKEFNSDYTALAGSIARFADFNGCTTVELVAAYPISIKKPLVKELSSHKQTD